MKGLILKDILFLKNNFKSLIVFLIFAVVFAFVMKDYTYMSFIIPFFTFMLLINTFAYDEYNKCDTFMLTLPFNRKQIVKSKYVLTIISYILATILCCIMTTAICIIQKQLSIETIVAQSIGTVLGISLTASILYPFIYKYGIQKARIYLFAVIIGITLIGSLLVMILKKVGLELGTILSNLNNINMYLVFFSVLGISLLIIYVSYRISSSIYQRKEF